MRKMLKNILMMGVAVVAMTAQMAAAAPGSVYGELVIAENGRVPQRDEVSFIAFVNGTDDVIHTEQTYNAPLGEKQGYVLNAGKGYWFVNFANFRTANDGQAYKVVFTTEDNAYQATMDSTVPNGYTGINTPVQMVASMAPAKPTGLKADRTSNGIEVSWDARAGVTYKVYRTKLPSGADNGRSNGIFEKVADGEVASFTDTDVAANEQAFYLVVGQNKNGVYSAHTEEVYVAPSSQFAPGKIQHNHMMNEPAVRVEKNVEQKDNHIPANPAK